MITADVSVNENQAGARGTIVRLLGDFDLMQRDRLNDILDAIPVNFAIVDFERTGYIDSTVVNALIRAKKRFETRNGSIALANVPANVRRILEICGLSDIFESASTADELLSERGMCASSVNLIVVKSEFITPADSDAAWA